MCTGEYTKDWWAIFREEEEDNWVLLIIWSLPVYQDETTIYFCLDCHVSGTWRLIIDRRKKRYHESWQMSTIQNLVFFVNSLISILNIQNKYQVMFICCVEVCTASWQSPGNTWTALNHRFLALGKLQDDSGNENTFYFQNVFRTNRSGKILNCIHDYIIIYVPRA